MARHRDDEDFGNVSRQVFIPVKNEAVLQLILCPARLVSVTPHEDSVDVDLSDLDFTPPDSSRVKTRTLPEEELTKNLETAFGHAHIRSRTDGAVSVNIVDEVVLDSLLNTRFR